MSTEFKNVIIIGAGGNLGPSIINAFLKHSSFNLTILTRSESKSTFPPSVKTIRADYSSLDSLTSAFKGQDVALSLVSGTALVDQQKLIDAAIAGGVKRFLPSEYGSNTRDDRVRAVVPVFEAKKKTVEYLQSKEGEIEWSSLITGPFFDWGLRVGFIGFHLPSKTATLIDGGNSPFTSTTLHKIGLSLIKILQNPDKTKNKYIYVSSFNRSQNDILSVVQKVSGEDWNVKYVKSTDLIAQGREKLGKHDFSGIADLIRGVAFGEGGLGDQRNEGLWNDTLGLEREDFEGAVRTVLGGKLVGEE
ncbi:NAD(P)-binding protein [Delitschia confertaspora ATCC 74209]|uniref:NAD(P)-binding protein n=1 Tax=Delitschia confertaspora ATCC 74209 TaxID=1513339 RepID=A0A9P4JGB1_9PLEO|nr:NAD(P)-binding protein [Delitschia confertaspora ATCC 74209]